MLVLDGPLALSADACTGDELVESPVVGLFAELGWSTVSALGEGLRNACSETT
jgi:hypothetical protein